jgi:hypothetical protein
MSQSSVNDYSSAMPVNEAVHKDEQKREISRHQQHQREQQSHQRTKIDLNAQPCAYESQQSLQCQLDLQQYKHYSFQQAQDHCKPWIEQYRQCMKQHGRRR